ncbi:hypothetical protein SDC9_123512 [bioreactor metagenome]|uniref:Uncharacterized protein n=1 Tax=bioreactor metagenome TaxID=1076179 RepID=A0A645CHZ4_9ZZZZ
MVDGKLRLLAHKGENLVVRPGLDSACVNQCKGAAVPVRLTVHPVPGDPGRVLHDGEPTADELIEQHGLAHIGPAHNGNNGFHGFPPVSIYSCPKAGQNKQCFYFRF